MAAQTKEKQMLSERRQRDVGKVQGYGAFMVLENRRQGCQKPDAVHFDRIDKCSDQWGFSESCIYHIDDDRQCWQYPFDFTTSLLIFLLHRFPKYDLNIQIASDILERERKRAMKQTRS